MLIKSTINILNFNKISLIYHGNNNKNIIDVMIIIKIPCVLNNLH